MFNQNSLIIVLLSAVLLLLNGCANDDHIPDLDKPEQELYEDAQRDLNDFRYESAIENLQALEARYPFGQYAEQAQLDLVYAYYKNHEPAGAAAAAERFIRLHPQHPNVDYAYYMKGLSSFNEGKGLFERYLTTDMTKRDPGAARRSFSEFAQLLARFPDSQYASDAQKRMLYLRNLLARYEVHVANYYFKRGAYLAAANRGRYVIENFQQTPAIPDALAVMVQAYRLLQLDELSNDALAVLQNNFPEYPALEEDGEFIMQLDLKGANRSWLNVLTVGLLDPPEPPGFDTRAIYEP